MPIPAELKAALDEIRVLATANPQLIALQKQADAIDKKLAEGHFGAPIETKSLRDIFKEDDSIQRLLTDRKGRAVVNLSGGEVSLLQRKTVITEIGQGSQVTGVMPIGRLPGITAEARQQLSVRDALSSAPTTFSVIDFLKVSQPMSPGSMVPEASVKPENQLNFTSASERVKVVASWIPASRQVLDDLDGLVNFIQTSLVYYVNLTEEQQLLSGDNVGEDLHGLLPQASQFNQGLLNPARGWNRIDVIGCAIQQITAAKELAPSFLVVHPNDWWGMRLTKDGFGRYILGDPQQGGYATSDGYQLNPTENLFGLMVVPTTSIAAGTFLVGSGSAVAAQILDRMEMQIDVSTEHASFFTQNLIAVRAEKRLALVVRRPGSFVTGSFSSSPFAP